MNVVIDNEFGRVWSDNASPVVFTFMRRMPSQKETLEVFHQKQEDLMRHVRQTYNRVYTVCDLSQCKGTSYQLLLDYVGDLNHQFKSGLMFKAFISPSNLIAQCSLEEIIKSYKDERAHVFQDFGKALAAINDLRLKHVDSKKNLLTILRAAIFA